MKLAQSKQPLLGAPNLCGDTEQPRLSVESWSRAVSRAFPLQSANAFRDENSVLNRHGPCLMSHSYPHCTEHAMGSIMSFYF